MLVAEPCPLVVEQPAHRSRSITAGPGTLIASILRCPPAPCHAIQTRWGVCRGLGVGATSVGLDTSGAAVAASVIRLVAPLARDHARSCDLPLRPPQPGGAGACSRRSRSGRCRWRIDGRVGGAAVSAGHMGRGRRSCGASVGASQRTCQPPTKRWWFVESFLFLPRSTVPRTRNRSALPSSCPGGRGSRWLDRRPRCGHGNHRPRPRIPSNPQRTFRNGGYERAVHLLVVEDDRRLARVLERLLRADRHVVEVAETGR